MTVDLAPLRSTVEALQLVSLELDDAKAKAEARLRKLIRKWEKRVARRHWISSKWCQIKNLFGDAGACDDEGIDIGVRMTMTMRAKHARMLMKAAEDVKRINKKLAGFERGFIVEEGLGGREWYKVCLLSVMAFDQ